MTRTRLLALGAFALLIGFTIAPLPAAAQPADSVKISIERWRKPGSNNIGTADISITNDNAFAVKDIRVQCAYIVTAGGRKIDTEQNLPVTVKAKSTQKFKKLKFAYVDTSAATGSCMVKSATQM